MPPPLASPPPPAARRSVMLRLPASAELALKALLATVVVAALHYGQDILVPLALAGLLAFVLDPLVTRLQRLRLPRPASVALVVMALAGAVAFGAFEVGGQVMQLGRDLPRYESTIAAKLRTLRRQLVTPGGRGSLAHLREAVEGELAATRKALETPASPAAAPATPAPAPAVRVVAEPTPLQAWRDALSPLAGPLATAGLVVVLLIFMLLERGSLRDRLLRLAGNDLHLMTAALDEAAGRVSRYLSMQVMVNAGHGLALGTGLWLIGVPGAALWGVLAALLRFVPYVGPVVSAAFPLALAFAVDPGWNLLVWTLALVVLLELVVNNIVEPWAYGATTGLASLAVLVSAAFWTLMWGVVGLVLATPLTVCLLVLGRHLAPLRFLDLLLRSEPVFDAPTRLYQRLLAGDVDDALELAEQGVQAEGLQGFYAGTALPALGLLAADQMRLGSSAACERAGTAAAHVLDELALGSPVPARPAVLCLGLRGGADAAAAGLLAHALREAGTDAAAASDLHDGVINLSAVAVACLCSCGPRPDAAVRSAARRLRRRHPGLRIVLLAAGAGVPDAAALGVDGATGDLAEAIALAAGRDTDPSGVESYTDGRPWPMETPRATA